MAAASVPGTGSVPFSGAGTSARSGGGGGGRTAATALSFVDAQRAAAVLEDAVEKLEFLRSVEPDVLTHKEELSAAMGDEVERVMRRQTELEERYRKLLDERAALQGVVNKKQRLTAIKAEITEVDRELKDVTKGLSRALKDNPRVGDNLRKMVSERNQLLDLLRGAVAELRSGSGHLGEVETFVREEQEARQMLEGLKEEEDELTKSVEQLRKQMLAERERHARQSDSLRVQMEAVKDKVRQSKDRTVAVARADIERADAATQARARALALTEAKLRAKLVEVEASKEEEASAHKQTAQQLSAEQAALAERLAGEAAVLESAVADATDRVAALEAKRQENRERLAALMARWEEETERERVEAEAQREREIQHRRTLADAQRRARAAEALRAIIPDAFDLVRAFAQTKKKKKKKGKK